MTLVIVSIGLLLYGDLGRQTAETIETPQQWLRTVVTGYPQWERDRAEKQLLAAREQAVPALIEGLGDPGLRRDAARLIKHLGPSAKAAVPAVVREIRRLDGKVDVGADEETFKIFLVEALGGIGPDAQPAIFDLIACLPPPRRWGLREACAFALGSIGPAAKDAVPALLEMVVGDDDRHIRSAAMDGLAGIREGALPALLERLEDDSLFEETLGRMQAIGPDARAAIPALLRLRARAEAGELGPVSGALAEIDGTLKGIRGETKPE
jgi:HEAT repeat protein